MCECAMDSNSQLSRINCLFTFTAHNYCLLLPIQHIICTSKIDICGLGYILDLDTESESGAWVLIYIPVLKSYNRGVSN